MRAFSLLLSALMRSLKHAWRVKSAMHCTCGHTASDLERSCRRTTDLDLCVSVKFSQILVHAWKQILNICALQLAGIATEVMAFQDECARELQAAEPIIAEAEAALGSLDKASLGELKSFGSPAAEVVQVRATLFCGCERRFTIEGHIY